MQRGQHHRLPFSFHASTLPFTIDRSDIEDACSKIQRLYDSADDDATSSLPADSARLLRDILSMEAPTLKELVHSVGT